MIAKSILLAHVFLGLFASVMLARGPKGTDAPELVLLWSARSTLGPVFYPADAAPPERQAAEDLARTLTEMSGHEWRALAEPACGAGAGIFIGNTHRAQLDGVGGAEGRTRRELLASEDWDLTEAFIEQRRVVINGVTPEATRAGVYRFLQEALGCLWVAPGESGDRLPQRDRQTLRQGRRYYQPAYLDRAFNLGKNRPKSPEALWALRNGASNHFYFNHYLYKIFTPEVLSEHEAWRAWRFDERTALSDVQGSGAQPDLTNPNVVAFAADFVRNAAEEPDRLTVSLGTNDSTRYDDSTTTREVVEPFQYHRSKPVYSDLVFGFTNMVTGQIAPSEAPIYLTQLAYMWAEPPPGFSIASNIMPYLCSDQSQWYDPQYRATDQKLIEAWSQAGPRMLGFWEYYQGQPFLIPRYFPTIMAESLRFGAEHRVRGAFFSGSPVWGFDAPKFWLAGQLGWRPEADHEELLEQYFDAAYGKASGSMSRFFDGCEAAWMAQPGEGRWLKYWENPDQFALFDADRRKELSRHLERAELLASIIPNRSERKQAQALIEQTVTDWAVTCAGAGLYEAWLAVPYPGEGRGAPTAIQATAFQAAREHWLVVDHAEFNRSGSFIELLNQLDPLERWDQSGWQSVSRETFVESIFVGDLAGGGPEPIHPDRFQRNWVTLLSHAEGASIQRVAPPSSYLRIEAVDYFNLYRWLEIQPGVGGEFRLEARLRGQLSPGAEAEIRLHFMDAHGKPLPGVRIDRLRPGEFDDWVSLGVIRKIPANATHVMAGLRVNNHFRGDWIEVESIDLQHRLGNSGAAP